MEKLNVEIVCDGELSSATLVIRNVIKCSRHNCTLHQWKPKYSPETDIIYFHYGGLLTEGSTLEDFFKQRGDFKRVAGIRGVLNLKRWFVSMEEDSPFLDFVYELDGISCANEKFKKICESKRLSSVFVCHSGVDTRLFKYTYPPDEFCIGWAGSGMAGSKMFRNFIKLPFPKRTSAYDFGTFRPFNKMPDFYKLISVYVSTSVEEGSPLPPKEAAASGRPVVAIGVGDLPEWVPKEYLADSWEGLIPIIKRLESDRELLVYESKRFRELSLQWDYENVAKEYDGMFESVMKP